MKFQLPVATTFGNFAIVEAEMVWDIAPHLADLGTFAVHKEPSSRRWNVSNVETGLHVVDLRMSRVEAIKDAKIRLAEQTRESLLAAYRKAFEQTPQLNGGKS